MKTPEKIVEIEKHVLAQLPRDLAPALHDLYMKAYAHGFKNGQLTEIAGNPTAVPRGAILIDITPQATKCYKSIIKTLCQ